MVSEKATIINVEVVVLILVVVEYGLGAIWYCTSRKILKVLILVVVEYGLGVPNPFA